MILSHLTRRYKLEGLLVALIAVALGVASGMHLATWWAVLCQGWLLAACWEGLMAGVTATASIRLFLALTSVLWPMPPRTPPKPVAPPKPRAR